jgi:predicted glycosyltransferase
MGAAKVAELRALVHGVDAQVHAFRTDMERVIAGARAVVSMAGYNTVAELMQARKPALLVPRARPSAEQLVRARGLAERGLAALLEPDSLAPETMRAALGELLERREPAPEPDEYDGGERAATILAGLTRRQSAPVRRRPSRAAVPLARAAQ